MTAKEYLTGILKANEEVLYDALNDLHQASIPSDGEQDYKLNRYEKLMSHHLSAIDKLSNIEKAEEQFEIDKLKRLDDIRLQEIQIKNDLYKAAGDVAKDVVLQLGSQMFYNGVLNKGLTFEQTNVVSSGLVRGIIQKSMDFMKTKK